ncbi:hypothetical protein DAY19_11760 [Halobacteriovorax vibrionivorans]|uniref:HipA N-terminal subdomain 1 domain-containing protein n=1 Tax=Halobacteriovorax vibrionivorans TaxID=2152716 RepID=A0ABY0ICH0_9BACT|nr:MULTISPECIES: hypothetical protein [Halobacteriovorax]RZF20654.1 hypothetical protein DAY19_11760 [Halobacteriovorax vibrionivorans]TGD48936.1 hypothetical protein EP118_01970 [Halobacteriovorax sp. Y22]
MNEKVYTLVFKNIEIGYIREDVDGDLVFEYSDAFKSSKMRALPHFPNVNKKYKKSSVLNFLLNRIPSKAFKSQKFTSASELIGFGRKVGHSPIELVG